MSIPYSRKSVRKPLNKDRPNEGNTALSPGSLAIAKIITEHILPGVEEHGVSLVVLGRSHLVESQMAPGVRLSRSGHSGKVEKKQGRNSIVLARWPESEMEALRYPCLCFIYEGEADIPVGDAVLHCPAARAIVVPAGVPLTQGLGPHWLRAQPEKAHSRILWFSVQPFGAHGHLCRTDGCHHVTGDPGECCVAINRQLLPLTEQLIDELDRGEPLHETIAASLLATLLCLLLRHLSREISHAPQFLPHNVLNAQNMDEPGMIIQRAQMYIENNLAKPLTLHEIAQASYISRTRLALLFRRRLDKSVWEYITGRRIEEAANLLVETNLYIYDIARLCGFSHPSHFFVRFAEVHGMTPHEYRSRFREPGQAAK